MHFFDELLEHLFGDGEVGDNAVFHRPDGGDVSRRLAQHLLGFLADRLDGFFAVGAAFLADGNDRGLIQNDAFAAYINQGVCGSEVDREIVRKIATQKTEHAL